MNLISPAELSYITDSLFAENRLDGRSLLQFREIHVSTQVISQSAGSARVACAGTDVLVGIRLETRDAKNDQDADEGKAVQISLVVSSSALQSLPSDPTLNLLSHVHLLTSSLAHHPQLVILPFQKYWQLHIDISILSSGGGGNLYDILSIAVRSALWDLKIPRTKPVAYVKPGSKARGDDTEEGGESGMKALLKGKKGALDLRKGSAGGKGTGAADFEILDYEAEAGEQLNDREKLPLSLSLNLTPQSHLPFLDATLFESFASPTRLTCTFDGLDNLRGMHQEIPDGSATSAPNEISLVELYNLIDVSLFLLREVSGQRFA
ncbi:MAG: hypothetical protein CYPHOPRED_004546 [Cyphobasidiales sp. Tagirdzhanova-0007]|nr:MAG: hypothetical protein CYPHOPRED_004546 [Cyphobasidiales sp. Tagirdzhanova-0007]